MAAGTGELSTLAAVWVYIWGEVSGLLFSQLLTSEVSSG